MGLLQNRGWHNGCGTRFFGSTTFNTNTLAGGHSIQPKWAGVQRNRFNGSQAITDDKASVPDGARHPVAWVLPQKAGGLSSRNAIEGTFSLSGDGNYGRNMDATINWDTVIDQANLGLIVGATATINFDTTITQAALGGTQNMEASFTGISFTINSVISAESGLGATITFSATLNGSVATALGDMEATISGVTEAITPASIAAEVWNSVALAFNVAGTMGNKMNSAASAGDPWTTNLPGAYLAGTAGQIIGTLQNDINLHTDSAIQTLNLAELKFAIESLRPHHTAYGTAFFWNPSSGDDSADGLTPATARKTFASIQANLVTDYGHDIVYCLPDGNGTTSAEPITITKNYLFVRGPGRDFEIDSTTAGGTAVTILADGVELHGVRVKTDTASSADGIVVTGDFAYLDQVWIDSCGGNAINISSSSNTIVNGGYYRGYKGHGIKVGSSTNHLWVKDVGLHGSSTGTGSGVYIDGTSIFEVKLYGRCDIHANVRYALEVVNANSRISISPDTLFETNTLGDIYDPNGKVVYDGRVTIQNETAVAVGDHVVEGTYTRDEVMRILAAALAGKVSGAGTGTEVFKGLDGTTNRITSTVDTSGNRTAVSVDGT